MRDNEKLPPLPSMVPEEVRDNDPWIEWRGKQWYLSRDGAAEVNAAKYRYSQGFSPEEKRTARETGTTVKFRRGNI